MVNCLSSVLMMNVIILLKLFVISFVTTGCLRVYLFLCKLIST